MSLRIYVTTRTLWAALTRRLVESGRGLRRLGGDRGQTTAEYALVIIGAAAVALLLLAWATGSGKVSSLLDKVVDRVADMVT